MVRSTGFMVYLYEGEQTLLNLLCERLGHNKSRVIEQALFVLAKELEKVDNELHLTPAPILRYHALLKQRPELQELAKRRARGAKHGPPSQ